MSTSLLQAIARKAGTTNVRVTHTPSGLIVVLPSTIIRGPAELPRVVPDTTPYTVTGISRVVHSGGDLQGAMNAANYGDEIVVDYGATFSPVTIPNTSGWTGGGITIRTSATSLAAPGARINPNSSDSGKLFRILTTNSGPAVQTTNGCHHWRIIGGEMGVDPSYSGPNYGVVTLGDGTTSSLSALPHHLGIDRSWIHGNANKVGGRGIALNSGETFIIGSYIDQCGSAYSNGNGDAQGIAGWGGSGPFLIDNNLIEGSVENVLFGGADPAILLLTPSDITITRNHMHKPKSWFHTWQCKNILEFKNARRVLVQHNVFENCWADAQNGTALLVTPANQSTDAPWCTVQDVTYDTNHVIDVARLLVFSANPGYVEHAPATRAARISMVNMLAEKLGSSGDYPDPDGDSYSIALLANVDGVSLRHITALDTNYGVDFTGAPWLDGFVLQDNILGSGDNTIIQDGGATGQAALTNFCSVPYTADHNVLVLPSGLSGYPAGNFSVASLAALALNSDSSLPTGSPYHNAASDGTDIGANVAAILAATAGVVQDYGS